MSPTRAERAALAAASPLATAPTTRSRKDRLLGDVNPRNATPEQRAQLAALDRLCEAYRRACEAARDLVHLGCDPRAIYDHHCIRDWEWRVQHVHGCTRALPWRATPRTKGGLTDVRPADSDAVTDSWASEVHRRVVDAVARFDAAWIEVCAAAWDGLLAALSKALVYEYVYDVHEDWARVNENLPWVWKAPRRLTF